MDHKTSRNCPPVHEHITVAVASSIIIIIDCLGRRVVGGMGKRVIEVGNGNRSGRNCHRFFRIWGKSMVVGWGSRASTWSDKHFMPTSQVSSGRRRKVARYDPYLLFRGTEDLLVLLLSLLESILEEVGVCKNKKLVGVHVYR